MKTISVFLGSACGDLPEQKDPVREQDNDSASDPRTAKKLLKKAGTAELSNLALRRMTARQADQTGGRRGLLGNTAGSNCAGAA